MNSQVSRNVKASSARTTRFMPARNTGKKGSTRAGRRFVPAVAEAVQAGGEAAEIHDDEKERAQAVQAEMRAEPGQPDRQSSGGIDARVRGPAPERPLPMQRSLTASAIE